jgi:hypothetical protein
MRSPQPSSRRISLPFPLGALLLLAGVCPLAAHAQTPGARSTPRPIATITVDSQKPGALIPKNFLGFSNEVSTAGMGLPVPTEKALGRIHRPAAVPAGAHLAYVLGQPGDPNEDFFTFLRNLGPGVLRLGGNSQDNTCWHPGTAPHPDWCQGSVTPGQMKLYSAAARSAGWKLILGLNLKQNSPSWARSEAADGFAREIPSDEILGLEIGNEPDLFGRGPARPKTYSPANYVKDAREYIHAFRADPATRGYAFVAPATCCGWNNPRDLDAILKGIGPDLKLVSVHNYPTSTCGRHNVTPAELLSSKRMDRFNTFSEELVAVARKHGLPIAMAETNSASCGGMAGVSNAFVSAVWGVDYMLNIAHDGYVHVNFHFSYRTGGSAYNPVQVFGWQAGDRRVHYSNVAQPLYYAMYLFSQFASGERFLSASIKTRSRITAFATTACGHCAVHVFVINEDQNAAGEVLVHLSGPAAHASLLMLQAPSLTSLADKVRYGDRHFDTHGHIGVPRTIPVVPGANEDYKLTLPKAAVGVLSITR